MVEVPVAPGEAMLTAELVSEKAATGTGVPTVTVINAPFKLPGRLGESTSSVYLPAAVAASVDTVIAAVTGAIPEIVTGAGEMHVGWSSS
jgi:hypothetical protein